MRVWSRKRNEAAAWQKQLFHALRTGNRNVEMKSRRRCRRKEVNRPRRRMRVRALHVDDTFILGSFEFRKVRMHHRRAMRISVDMEEWSVKSCEYQRSDCAEGGYSSHGRILVRPSLKVNASHGYFRGSSLRNQSKPWLINGTCTAVER